MGRVAINIDLLFDKDGKAQSALENIMKKLNSNSKLDIGMNFEKMNTEVIKGFARDMGIKFNKEFANSMKDAFSNMDVDGAIQKIRTAFAMSAKGTSKGILDEDAVETKLNKLWSDMQNVIVAQQKVEQQQRDISEEKTIKLAEQKAQLERIAESYQLIETGQVEIDGMLDKTTSKYRDLHGNVVKVTESLKEGGATIVNTVNPIEKLSNEMEKLNVSTAAYKSNMEVAMKNLTQNYQAFLNSGTQGSSNIYGDIEKFQEKINAINPENMRELGLLTKELDAEYKKLTQTVKLHGGIYNTTQKEIANKNREVTKEIKDMTQAQKELSLYRMNSDTKIKDLMYKYQDFLTSNTNGGNALFESIEKFQERVNNINPNNLKDLKDITAQIDVEFKQLRQSVSQAGDEYNTKQKEMIANTKEVTKRMEELNQVQKDLSNFKSTMGNKINGIMSDFTPFLTSGSLGGNSLSNEIGKFQEKVNNINPQSAKDLKNIIAQLKIEFDQLKNSVESSSNIFDRTQKELAKNSKETAKAIQEEAKALKLKEEARKKAEEAAIREQEKQIAQIDEMQRKIENFQTKGNPQIANIMDQYKNMFDAGKGLQLKEELQAIQTEMNNLNASSIGPEKAGQKMQELAARTTAAKSQLQVLGREFNVTNNTAMKFSDVLKKALSQMGFYVSSAMLVRKAISEIKEGIKIVTDYDNAIANMKMTMGGTDEMYKNMISSSQNFAREIGTTSDKIMEMAKIYANATDDVAGVMEKLKPTALLSNISGMNVTETVNLLQGVREQFNLTSDDVVTSSNKISDAIVAISRDMAMDFSTGIQYISDGISTMGSFAHEAGYSLEEFSAQVAAISEATRKSGSEVANGLKMIYANMGKVTTGDSIDEEAVSKLDKALQKIKVSLRDSNGEFRRIQDVLNDLSKVWDTLDSVQRNNIATLMGGTRQRNIVLTLMNQQTRQSELYAKALDSEGAAMEANRIYMDSYEGKMNQVKNSVQEFWTTLINSQVLKDALGLFDSITRGITTMAKGMGGLNFAIITVVTTMGLLKGKLIESFVTKLGKAIIGIEDLTGAIGVFELGLAKIGGLIAANPIGAISVAIIAAVSVFGALNTAVDNATRKLQDFNQSYSQDVTSKGSSEVSKLVDEYKKMNEELVRSEKGSYTYNNTQDLMNQKLEELKRIMPDVKTAINEVTGAKELDIEATEQQIKMLEKLEEKKAKEVISKNGVRDIKETTKEIESYKKAMEDMKILQEGLEEDRLNPGADTQYGKILQSRLEATEKGLSAQKDKLIAVRDAMVKLNDGTGTYTSSIEAINRLLDEQNDKLDKNTDKKNENANAGSAVSEKAVKSVEEATEYYSQSLDKVEKLVDLTNKLNKQSAITPDIVREVTALYGDVGSRVTNMAQLQQFLNEKIAEQKDVTQKAYLEMLNADSEYYNQRVENSESLANAFIGMVNDMGLANAESYNVDAKNFKDLQEYKSHMLGNFKDAMISYLTKFLGDSAIAYEKDIKNAKNYAEAKLAVIESLNKAMRDSFQAMADLSSSIDATDNHLMRGNNAKLYDDKMSALQNKYNQLAGAKLDLDKVMVNFDTAIFGTNDVHFSSKELKDAEKAAKASKTKEAAVKDLTDRYHLLNEAINQTNNALSMLKIMQDRANDSEKIELIKQEIELYKKLQNQILALNNERRKEQDEIKGYLQSQGVWFNNDGIIGNYDNVIRSRMGYAESLTGDARSEAISQLDELEKAMKRYAELNSKLIPESAREYEELANKIKQAQENMNKINEDRLKTIASQEREIFNLIKKTLDDQVKLKKEAVKKELDEEKKRLDGIKKSLQEQKDLFKKSLKEDDYQESLNDERKKLAEIQAEIDRVSRATDAKSKALLNNLMKEYEAQQVKINSMIKDKTVSDTEERFDLEINNTDNAIKTAEDRYNAIIEKLDKDMEEFLKPENINRIIENALSDGLVTIAGRTYDVQEAMKNMLKETEIGFMGVATKSKEWLDTLSSVRDMYKDIGSITGSLGISNFRYDSNTIRGTGTGNFNFDLGGITIQGNTDESTIGGIQEILANFANTIYRNIANQLGN